MATNALSERPTCLDCKFWDSVSPQDGKCREGPPRASNTWAFTRFDDWCGRWKAAPPPPKTKVTAE